jgi:CRISPR/Cas system CSM-associated protein Csm3 (group 7 of RAMP superfamily)
MIKERNMDIVKPYQFISFPTEPPDQESVAGHQTFTQDGYSGILELTLIVQTALHSSTGIIALGSDVGLPDVSLIQPMIQSGDGRSRIQGSSLKGCIRSVYEAITNSTLGTSTTASVDSSRLPVSKPVSRSSKLCPAGRVFGAMGYQGLIEFTDAVSDRPPQVGYIQPLHQPRSSRLADGLSGRKFYYHTRWVTEGGNIPVQQAAAQTEFTTRLKFKNLKSEELGTLLVVLGQDPHYPIALKIGAGKPLGMGTIQVKVTAIEAVKGSDLKRDRYSDYQVPLSTLTGNSQQRFTQEKIQTAHARLIQKIQLDELLNVLRYPTDREPVEGEY